MNIIGLDPSLISTGMVIDGKIFNYVVEENISTKNGLSKWYKLCEEYITYKYIKHNKFSSYSVGEVQKLIDYDIITDIIIDDILTNINSDDIIIGIEGFSYSSAAGDLIDLVHFSTQLRCKLYKKVSKKIIIFSPSTLKLESAKLTYPCIKKGKKMEYRNKFGISGGNFSKTDMFLSLIENDQFDDRWINFLKSIRDEILCNKTIKKPLEDCNDAYLIFKILQKYNDENLKFI